MKRENSKRPFLIAACCTWVAVCLSIPGIAAGPNVPSQASNSLAITLIIIMIALLLIIGLLAYVLIGAAEISLQRTKAKGKAVAEQVTALLALCLLSTSAMAQESSAGTQVASTSIGGLSLFSYYTMLSVIGLLVLVIVVLLLQVQHLLAKERVVVAVVPKEATEPAWQKWWAKLNSFKPEHEVSDTGHNYDGIRELDNKLPPWWLYGFFACIVFALVYLYRYEVIHSAPGTVQEYEIAMAKAEVEKEAYLRLAANKVDENTVTLLTDTDALAAGKKLFGTACAACHGNEGQGVVGPNLTDDYWLHKGSVKDVFKIIKYGVPEKGMKSWKDDFNPVQISQLTSYIISLKGTNPVNAKEPQGELFKEEATADNTANGKGALTQL